jgi:hypothetical protein
LTEERRGRCTASIGLLTMPFVTPAVAVIEASDVGSGCARGGSLCTSCVFSAA